MKVILELEKGPNVGEQYELTLNAYRAVGRTGDGAATVQFTTVGDHVLEKDDLERVEAHLARRGPAPKESGSGLRFGTFKRGRDILLNDSKISRTHAMFFLDDDGPSVVDLLSTNGTHVNGKQVTDADLSDGDVVNVGKARFIVHIVD